MYVLDTNICIALMQRHPLASVRFSKLANRCAIPTIVLGELSKGAYCSQQVQKNLKDIGNFLELVDVIDFDSVAADEFGKIQSTLRRMGRPTGDFDALIAAVARVRGETLVTHNTRHFKNIPELMLEDWLIDP